MIPGFYVVRIPRRSSTGRMIVESVPFKQRFRANRWRGFIQDQHPKDDVFVIERFEIKEGDDEDDEPASAPQ